MNRKQKTAIVAALLRAGRRDLARQFVGASDTFKQVQSLLRTNAAVKAAASKMMQALAKESLTPEDKKVIQQWIVNAGRILANKIDSGRTSPADLAVISVNSTPKGGLPSDTGGRLLSRVGGQIDRVFAVMAEQLLGTSACVLTAKVRKHKDVEYMVGNDSFKTFDDAAADAMMRALTNRDRTVLDVVVHSEKGAKFYAGDDGVARYRTDPDRSVFERFLINVSPLGPIA